MRRFFGNGPHSSRGGAVLLCAVLIGAAVPALAQQTTPTQVQGAVPAPTAIPAQNAVPASPPQTATAPATIAPATTPAPATTGPATSVPAAPATVQSGAPPANPSTAPAAVPTVPGTPPGDPAAAVPGAPVAPAEGGIVMSPTNPNSIMHMFTGASPVVQGVMLLLLAASIATWTVILVKSIEFAAFGRRLRRDAQALRRSTSWPTEVTVRSAAGRLAASLAEGGRGIGDETLDGRLVVGREALIQSARRGVGLLATIGSVGPFVGLFGTVWGIMNSFIGIADSHSTNLATVAPGIAEALLATAMGLVAAIPAVVGYNVLTRRLSLLRLALDTVAVEVRRLARAPDGARLSKAAE